MNEREGHLEQYSSWKNSENEPPETFLRQEEHELNNLDLKKRPKGSRLKRALLSITGGLVLTGVMAQEGFAKYALEQTQETTQQKDPEIKKWEDFTAKLGIKDILLKNSDEQPRCPCDIFEVYQNERYVGTITSESQDYGFTEKTFETKLRSALEQRQETLNRPDDKYSLNLEMTETGKKLLEKWGWSTEKKLNELNIGDMKRPLPLDFTYRSDKLKIDASKDTLIITASRGKNGTLVEVEEIKNPRDPQISYKK